MFEFIHDIMEAWILDSTSGVGLGRFPRAVLQRHLNSCRRCRSFALDLIEFSHSLESGASSSKLSAEGKEELHARVMAAFHRELLDERSTLPFQRAEGPAIRPSFIKALALASLIVAAVFVLGYPYRKVLVGGDEGSAASTMGPNTILVTADASPTPTPNPR